MNRRIEVNRREIYRYLGMGKTAPEPRLEELVESCICQLEEVISPRHFMMEFPLSFPAEDTMDFTCFTVKSRHLYRNLKDCGEVMLFAASLGTGPDYLIQRYGRLEMSRAVVLQAAAAAMIESYCDQINGELKEQRKRIGKHLRPRFSPGYGDFDLSYQEKLCAVLSAEKTVGITLTDSFLMIPSKSVTAVIGVSKQETDCHLEGCWICDKKNCLYRREKQEEQEE